MYIHKISLRNVRGFEKLDFELKRPDGSYPGWTVFTGDNGAGKSTLLKAIAVCLTGKDTARALQPSFHRWIRHGMDNESSIQLEIVRIERDDDLSKGGPPPGPIFPARLKLEQKGKETSLSAVVPPGKQKGYKIPERTIWSAGASGWFSCGYGPFRRVFGASSEATQIMVSPSTARFATMFQEAASLAEADRWLRDLKYKELENKQAEREQLDVLLRLIKDDLIPQQLSVARVDSDGLWLIDKKGVELAWTEMSDGFRAALALLTDIIRHLVNAYGVSGLTEIDDQGRVFVSRSGVVLIDEIDAHLHPSWQRNIGFWLKKHFPKIQFIVTTHSPIICQAADPNGLFVLPEPGSATEPHPLSEEEYRKVISSRPDTILLSAAFGLDNTRSPRAVSGRAEYAKLQAKKRGGGTLTPEEEAKKAQLSLFAITDESP